MKTKTEKDLMIDHILKALRDLCMDIERRNTSLKKEYLKRDSNLQEAILSVTGVAYKKSKKVAKGVCYLRWLKNRRLRRHTVKDMEDYDRETVIRYCGKIGFPEIFTTEFVEWLEA